MLFAEGLDAATTWLRARSPAELSVVAVDGQSAAGKSTFADALAMTTGASLVRGDDFYRVTDEESRLRLSPREGIDVYYDWQRMRNEVLLPLRTGRRSSYDPYDWDSGVLAERVVTIPTARAVILDGLFVSRPELRRFIDLSVLITAPANVRRRRQIERADASEEWLQRWEAAERLFFPQVCPPETFDIVVCDATS